MLLPSEQSTASLECIYALRHRTEVLVSHSGSGQTNVASWWMPVFLPPKTRRGKKIISYLLQKGTEMWGKIIIWLLGTKQGFVVDHCQLMVHKARTLGAWKQCGSGKSLPHQPPTVWPWGILVICLCISASFLEYVLSVYTGFSGVRTSPWHLLM